MTWYDRKNAGSVSFPEAAASFMLFPKSSFPLELPKVPDGFRPVSRCAPRKK
jgi:hypothetical protein